MLYIERERERESHKSVPTRRRRLSSPLRLLPLAVLFVQEGRGVEHFTISDLAFPYRSFLPSSIPRFVEDSRLLL